MTELKSSTKTRSILLIVFGAAWTVVASAFIFIPIAALINRPLEAELGWALLPLLILPALGLVLMAAGIYPWVAWLRVSRPEITIDKTALVLGESFTVGYSQIFKRRSEVRGIQLSLVMIETATYRSGKHQATVHHEEILAQYDHPGRTYEPEDTLAFSHTLGIPPGGMHTFQAMHNSIGWKLRVKVDVAGWPDYLDSFDLQVLPAPVP
jgi:hypothetical protein